MSCSAKVAEAFVKMQEDLKNPQNSAYNPISKSKYAPLSEILNFIRPILAKQGLAVCQNLGSTSEGKPTIQTIIIHESGETIETKELCLDSDSNKRMSILQEMGSSVTYGKRYQLCAFLGIAPENDNDGNDSTAQTKQTTQKGKEMEELKEKREQITHKTKTTHEYVKIFFAVVAGILAIIPIYLKFRTANPVPIPV